MWRGCNDNVDFDDNLEQIYTMRDLQDVFANIQYEEISPLFDEMESMSLSLAY